MKAKLKRFSNKKYRRDKLVPIRNDEALIKLERKVEIVKEKVMDIQIENLIEFEIDEIGEKLAEE